MRAAVAALALLAAAGAARAQDAVPAAERARLAELTSRLRAASAAGEHAFELAKLALQDELLRERAEGVLPSTAAVNDTSDAVLRVYAARRATADPFPVQLAARYSNDAKAKRWLLDLLARPDWQDAAPAVSELIFSDLWKGDKDLELALLRLSRREERRSVMPAAALRRLDPGAALPEILRLAETTDDAAIFYKSAGLLSDYGRLDLLPRVYRRVPRISERRGNFPVGLLDATSSDLLLRCLESCADREFREALAALPEARRLKRDRGPRAAETLAARGRAEKDTALRKEIEAASRFMLQ